MAKRMLIDATHPEETRVVVLNESRLEEFDFESANKKQIKGNIYLAKVMRVEPSLQACFVEYGGNRHGFLSFSEIHPDYYRIPQSDREQLLSLAREEEEEEEESQEADESGAAFGSLDAPYPSEEAESSPAADARFPEPADLLHPHPIHATRHETGQESNQATSQAMSDGTTELLLDPGLESLSEPLPESLPESLSASLSESEPPLDVTYASLPVITVGGDVPEIFGRDEVVEKTAPDVKPRPRSLRNYKIQDVIVRRQVLLIQVVKEERGSKGAALTTYLSLAGRYCVLMPNAPRGGGVSRKITSLADRKRLKAMVDEFHLPDSMGVIVRTAGMERPKPEIRRDLDYLLRLWNTIRDSTLQSMAPCLIHEEGDLIKRSIRDLYSRDIDEILVAGEEGYKTAKSFMQLILPSHAKRVQNYRDDTIPIMQRYQVELQLDAIHSPVVQLKSGGYIVINPTEALVAIDVNSGRATRERGIEETAVKTNLEAVDEVARQIRLRDLAGLVVIDFIDMEDNRNIHAVERRIRDAMKNDRARIQIGSISPFGLMELSRQRLRSSLLESSSEICPHCQGTGRVRSIESTSLHVLRGLEEEGIAHQATSLALYVPTDIAFYILNHKRQALALIEQRYGFIVELIRDDTLYAPAFRIERRELLPKNVTKSASRFGEIDPNYPQARAQLLSSDEEHADEDEVASPDLPGDQAGAEDGPQATRAGEDKPDGNHRRGRSRRRRDQDRPPHHPRNPEGRNPEGRSPEGRSTEGRSSEGGEREAGAVEAHTGGSESGDSEAGSQEAGGRRRRGRRGGRRGRRDPLGSPNPQPGRGQGSENQARENPSARSEYRQNPNRIKGPPPARSGHMAENSPPHAARPAHMPDTAPPPASDAASQTPTKRGGFLSRFWRG
ncbi:MAG: Rne/Rng family ribonuclease [Candidatus Symbiobacter sp.]|nr:Rne/Rng family ribonuclease [Candidatus Symbiobacter sp.]